MGTVPQIGKGTLYASQSGAVLDCVMSTGLNPSGGTPTDNTAVLNAAIGTPTPAAPLKLLMDGGSLVTQLLTTGGDLTIQGNGWDTGIFEKASGGVTALKLGPTAGPTVYNLELRDLKIDGNQPNNTVVNFLASFYYISQILIDRVWFHNPTYFNTYFINCSDIVIANSLFQSDNTTTNNTDGIHICGPSSDIRISNCRFRTNDDAIAIDAPEGNGGNISNVAVDNCTFDNCKSMMRVYGLAAGTAYTCSNIVVSNCVGSVSTNGFILGLYSSTGTVPADIVRDFSAVNVSLQVGSFFAVFCDTAGAVNFTNCTSLAPTTVTPAFAFQKNGAVISSMSLVNFRIYRTTAGNSAAFALGANSTTGCVIKKLVIDGFHVDNEQGQSYAAIPYLIDMLDLTITELVIDALDSTLITALVNPVTGFTGVGSISGAGVLATGFQIPDSAMANGTPYISATSPNAGKPCIKLGGTVYPYAFA